MKTHVLQTQRLMAMQLVEALPPSGAVGQLRQQWLTQLVTDANTLSGLLPYIQRVHRFAVPSAFYTLLAEPPEPTVQPALWTVDVAADATDPVVGCLALMDSFFPPMWVRYAHPQWLWTPAGVGCLLWRGVTEDNPALLAKARTVYDWLSQKGYGHLLLENALHQLPGGTCAEGLIPPAQCPLAKADWQKAQTLLPVLQRGLIISASDAPSPTGLFGAVAQTPNTPWTIVHTGWLWLLDQWLHPDSNGDTLALLPVGNLLRQSIDTVVLHRMLTSDLRQEQPA